MRQNWTHLGIIISMQFFVRWKLLVIFLNWNRICCRENHEFPIWIVCKSFSNTPFFALCLVDLKLALGVKLFSYYFSPQRWKSTYIKFWVFSKMKHIAENTKYWKVKSNIFKSYAMIRNLKKLCWLNCTYYFYAVCLID